MAARKQLFHPDEVKKKIRTSQLINRLQNNAFADEEFLTAGQIKSIETLLDRTIPRLKSVEVQGDPDKPLTMDHRISGIRKLAEKLDAVAGRKAG